MQVGDYVRTDKGYITKISSFKEHYTKGRRLGFKEEVIENYLLLDNKQCEIIESIDYSIPPCYPSDEELEKIKSHIIKSSSNIIDLIEVGDYVNGMEVMEADWFNENGEYEEGLAFPMYASDDLQVIENWLPLRSVNIKSIVTKEQFEAMEYKL